MSHERTALRLAGAAIVGLGMTVGFAGSASAQSCDALWYERNQIDANNGYCFETARARSFRSGMYPALRQDERR